MSATIDVSDLPRHAHGHATPVWWGAVLFICIEATGFALLVASYLYVRGNVNDWPPEAPLRALPASLAVAAYVASLAPMWLALRAAKREDLRGSRIWLVVATGLSLAALALRWWEISSLPFKWTSTAYASIVWSTTGLHVVETAAGVGENLFMTAVLFTKVDKRHFVDLETNVLFWFFVVLVWVPIFLLFYLEGAVR